MMDSVYLVLQPGLLGNEARSELWKKTRRKMTFAVGFLAAGPDAIPEIYPEHPLQADQRELLASLAGKDNQVAAILLQAFSAPGQGWLKTFSNILEKPANQDVVNRTLDAASHLFSKARPEGKVDMTLEELVEEANSWAMEQSEELRSFYPHLVALRVLSGLGYGVVRPVFSKTDAIGSLMRRKLQPITEPLLDQVNVLM